MEHQDQKQSPRGDQERDQDRPNRESNEKPAEGSRDTNSDVVGNERKRGTGSMSKESRESTLTEEAVGQSDDAAGGISNRPLDEEEDRQEDLPPRGERREEKGKED